MYKLKKSEWNFNLKIDVKVEIRANGCLQVLWLVDKNSKEAK